MYLLFFQSSLQEGTEFRRLNLRPALQFKSKYVAQMKKKLSVPDLESQ